MPPKFFITHSHHDNAFARRLCDDLHANGLSGFFDVYSIQAGDDIAARIAHGLEECDVYVPVLSPSALKSPWCEREINVAINLSMETERNGRPRIIPVLAEKCRVPVLLKPLLYIDFVGRYNDALNELLTKGFGLSPKPSSHTLLDPSPRTNWLKPVSVIVAMAIVLICIAIGALSGIFSQSNSTPTRVALATSNSAPTNTSMPTESPKPTITSVPIASPTNTAIPTMLPTNTTMPTATPTNTPIPTFTATPLPPTRTPTSSPTPTLGVGSTKISADGAMMVYVPAGKFWMGSNDADKQAYNAEKPQHEVDLDAFWIDKFEITNALYKKCVDASNCTAPKANNSKTRNPYYGDSRYDNYPVINVTRENAIQYCTIAKKQLPTEAQWEKAARGTDKRIYPWGDTFDASKLNSAEGGKGDTTAVGSYPSGASPYGAMDMAGNVWEWVTDWWGIDYYINSPARNPTGPTSGQYREVRGGSWMFPSDSVRAAHRGYGDSVPANDLGFRCVE